MKHGSIAVLNYLKFLSQIIIAVLLFFVFLLIEQNFCKRDFDILKFDARYEIDKKTMYSVNERIPKKPILLMGCSFMYGYGLESEGNPSYLLAWLTGLPVINRSKPGYGIQHMLYQLKRDDFYDEVREPEYCIFLFIDEHVIRLFQKATLWPEGFQYLRYKEKGGDFAEDNTIFYSLYRLYIPNRLQHMLAKHRSNADFNKNFNLIKKYFICAKNEAGEHWKDTKFVIIVYQRDKNFFCDTMRWKELEDDGFQIIYLKDINNGRRATKKDCLDDGFHPNGEFWQRVIPNLVKKLDLEEN